MRDITKKRIINIVKAYRQLFPREYELAAAGNKERALNQLTDWGETDGTSTVLEREILRLPTQLHTILYAKLTPEEQAEFDTDKGTLWFQRQFPEWVPNRKKA